MKTLVTAIQKGGQGKTFSTCHLAFDFSERGLKVLVVDLDPQANASYTLDNHKSGYVASRLFNDTAEVVKAFFSERDNSGITLIEGDGKLANLEQGVTTQGAIEALRSNIKALNEFFDVCLIDTPPTLGKAMVAAIAASDFVVSPIELERYSMEGMKKMIAVILNLRKEYPDVQFLGMLPNLVDLRKPRDKTNLEQLQKAYPQFVMPLKVDDRNSIAEALGERKPVWKIRKTAARKARQEVREYCQYVFERMEIA
ncbi:chromosome partitioning protein [Pseudomonas duriflava]|uniref:Chromosome partitioning protein n=1 Tax=Pseudomonas duriflava TaxID=459528 RepID=A0A562PJT2_9PSED|nr:ParA family protein [Pseudomonas duriflava]TWI44679.1 chromosome partitioning protein [Pseudomonas duriflava]